MSTMLYKYNMFPIYMYTYAYVYVCIDGYVYMYIHIDTHVVCINASIFLYILYKYTLFSSVFECPNVNKTLFINNPKRGALLKKETAV